MQNFRKIFEGNKSAYGQLILTGESTEKGKAIGKAFIKREVIPDQLWQDHLDGKDPALGIIPINEQNMCRWGCIDVDEYDLDHKKLAASIKSHKFPLVMFRSKSGGAHLFLFTTEFIAASLMQAKLKVMSEALSFGGSEIFPKQTEILVERGDTGNFLNLPYHGGIRGLRYAMDDEGNAIELQEFCDNFDKVAQTPEQLQELVVNKVETVSNEAFKDGPPCLNKLAQEGFAEGSRNNGLFNIAVYHKQADPDKWQDAVMASNSTYFDPPLPYQEVISLINSIGKRGYDKYRCKDQPICGVCNAAKCRTKKFGVGFEEEQMPELKDLVKINSTPPQWFLTVDGARIGLASVELYKPDLFALVCMDQGNKLVPTLKSKPWKEIYLKPLMNAVQIIKPLQSLNLVDQLENHLFEYTRNRAQGRILDDVANGVPWTDEEKGITYFKLEEFYVYLKRCNWELDKTKTGNLLKSAKGRFLEEKRMVLRTSRPSVISIKAFEKIEPTVSKTNYDNVPF